MNLMTSGGFLGSVVLAQGEAPTAGAAPKVNAVGVPGAETAAADKTASTTGAAPAGGGGAASSNGLGMMLTLIPVMAVLMIFSLMQGKKERKRREQLLNSVSKLDKVMVAGGIIGKVVELTDTEVVLQLEDGKMRVARSAIQSVLSSHSKGTSITEAKPESATANV